MEVRHNKPEPVLGTFDITGLTHEEMQTLVGVLGRRTGLWGTGLYFRLRDAYMGAGGEKTTANPVYRTATFSLPREPSNV